MYLLDSGYQHVSQNDIEAVRAYMKANGLEQVQGVNLPTALASAQNVTASRAADEATPNKYSPGSKASPSLSTNQTLFRWNDWTIRVDDFRVLANSSDSDAVFVVLDLVVRNDHNGGDAFIPSNCMKLLLGSKRVFEKS